MLFAAIYRTTNTTEEAQQRSLQLFTSWQPPVDFKAHYALADASGGIAIFESDDAAAVLESVAPFTPFFDFEVTPVPRDRAGRACVREDTGVARFGRLRPPSRARTKTAYAPSSTSRHSALTSRICSELRRGDEQRRAGDEHGEALRPRDRDVEPVAAEEELEAARDVVAARRRHREEHDRRLLARNLSTVPTAHAVRQLLAQAAHLRVVGRDDEDVLVSVERPRRPVLRR